MGRLLSSLPRIRRRGQAGDVFLHLRLFLLLRFRELKTLKFILWYEGAFFGMEL